MPDNRRCRNDRKGPTLFGLFLFFYTNEPILKFLLFFILSKKQSNEKREKCAKKMSQKVNILPYQASMSDDKNDAFILSSIL